MVQELLNRGWLPLLLRWLGLVHRPNLQIEALSALTTVAQTTTEHTPLLLKVSKVTSTELHIATPCYFRDAARNALVARNATGAARVKYHICSLEWRGRLWLGCSCINVHTIEHMLWDWVGLTCRRTHSRYNIFICVYRDCRGVTWPYVSYHILGHLGSAAHRCNDATMTPFCRSTSLSDFVDVPLECYHACMLS